MISAKNRSAAELRVAALRGRMVSLTVLELFTNQEESLDHYLAEKAAQAPDFFANAPLLLDFAKLGKEVDIFWLERMRELVFKNSFSFVGIVGASEMLEEAARLRGIPVWPSSSPARREREVVPEKKPDTSLEEVTSDIEVESVVVQQDGEPSPGEMNRETLVVRQPVRSGQKVYARGGDLIVMAAVSTGAEILADGHIHVYGTLRGRAVAGAKGMENARIFCQDLQADLVAVAGYYIINDDLPEDKRNRAVQIYLQGEELKIEVL